MGVCMKRVFNCFGALAVMAAFSVSAQATSAYSTRSAWLAAAGSPTASISFSTQDNGSPITNPSADALFSSLVLSGVEFLNVRSYWNQSLYVLPNQVLRAQLPFGTVAVGVDLQPFYAVAGNYTVTLSTGDVYTFSTLRLFRGRGISLEWCRVFLLSGLSSATTTRTS